jgi:hypothetical protein
MGSSKPDAAGCNNKILTACHDRSDRHGVRCNRTCPESLHLPSYRQYTEIHSFLRICFECALFVQLRSSFKATHPIVSDENLGLILTCQLHTVMPPVALVTAMIQIHVGLVHYSLNSPGLDLGRSHSQVLILCAVMTPGQTTKPFLSLTVDHRSNIPRTKHHSVFRAIIHVVFQGSHIGICQVCVPITSF